MKFVVTKRVYLAYIVTIFQKIPNYRKYIYSKYSNQTKMQMPQILPLFYTSFHIFLLIFHFKKEIIS